MADPTTILAYATKRRSDAQAEVTSAQQRLATAQTNVAAKTTALANVISTLAGLEQQAVVIRQKLAAAPTPADANALVDALETLTIRVRTTEAEVINAQAGLLMVQGDAARAQTEVATAGAQLTQADTALRLAEQAADQRAARALLLTQPPLSTLPAEAGDALDETTLPEGENYREAKARLTTDTPNKVADIPAKLFARAKERRQRALAPVAQADDASEAALAAVLKEHADKGGLAGVAEKTWKLFEQAEIAVEEFVTTAKARLDQAQADLARVADLENAPLTAEQTARINAGDPLKTDRETAVATEKTRDDKMNDVVGAQAALDAEILKALADGKIPDDVAAVQTKRTTLTDLQDDFEDLDDAWRTEEKDRDEKIGIVGARELNLALAIEAAVAAKNDVETDPGVIQATSDLNAAKLALETAEDTYDASEHGILHAWEAAVPDSMWRLVADFLAAEETLNELKNSDPTKLQDDLETAEADYVAAQLAADASASKLATLAAEQARREAKEKAERQYSEQRSFGALRGDN